MSRWCVVLIYIVDSFSNNLSKLYKSLVRWRFWVHTSNPITSTILWFLAFRNNLKFWSLVVTEKKNVWQAVTLAQFNLTCTERETSPIWLGGAAPEWLFSNPRKAMTIVYKFGLEFKNPKSAAELFLGPLDRINKINRNHLMIFKYWSSCLSTGWSPTTLFPAFEHFPTQ